MALVTFDVWNKKGAAQFHYSPITNYQNPPDLHINNGTIPFIKNGTYYYLSHPPMGFWLPYYSFKILGIKHNSHNLQWFNLLFHLLASLCVFSITKTLLVSSFNHSTVLQSDNQTYIPISSPTLVKFGDTDSQISPNLRINTLAITALLIFLFSPAMLWYGSNVYFSDIFVNHLFVITIWAGITMEKHLQLSYEKTLETSDYKPPPIQVYGQLLFCMGMLGITLLTEWIGYFLAASLFIYASKRFFNSTIPKKWYGLQIVLVSFVAIGGFIITFGTYSQILGFDAYWDYFLNRFLTRTGQMDNGIGGISIILFYAKQLLQHYATAFLPILLLLFLLLPIYWRSNKKISPQPPMKKDRNSLWTFIFWVALPPIFLHHFLFINYTVIHEYAIVKVTLPIAIFTAYLLQKVIQNQAISTKWLKIVLLFIITFCLLQYYYINRPGSYSWKGHPYDQFQRLGAKIQKEAKADEMVFVKGNIEINFQLVYYAKRNIWRYKSPKQMKEVLAHFGQEKGIVIEVED